MAGSPLAANIKIECVDYVTAEESASAGCAPDNVNNTGSDPGIKTKLAENYDSDDTTLTACSTEFPDINVNEEIKADAGVDDKPLSGGPSEDATDPLSGSPVVIEPDVVIGPTGLPHSTADCSVGFEEKKKTTKALKDQRPKVRKKKDVVEKYCNLCGYKTLLNRLLNQHMLIHTNEKPFACDLCGYRARVKSRLVEHMMAHTNEKPFACDLCGYQCRTNSRLIEHMMIHTNEKPFACDLCDFKSQRGSGLKRHILMVHNGVRRFVCDVCQLRCPDAGDLRYHMMTHTGERPFQCEYCDFKSSRSYNVKRHMVTHNKEKPLACELCDYKTASVSSMKGHMRTHTREKPFACDSCDYKCSSDSDLRKHVEISHSSSGCA